MTVIERYAEPRLVEYRCEDFYTRDEEAQANITPFLPAGCVDMSSGARQWGVGIQDTSPPA